MTNLAAAVALAQLECIEWHLDARARVRRWYEEHLGGLASRVVLQPLSTRGRHVHWMVAAEIHGFNARQRDAVMETLRESGIDTRPMFYPIHTMPPYEGSRSVIAPVSARLSSSGVVLPTSARLGEKDVVRICNTLGAAVEHHAVL
jgi:perosamine synthetase